MILKESKGLNIRDFMYLIDFENNLKVIKIGITSRTVKYFILFIHLF